MRLLLISLLFFVGSVHSKRRLRSRLSSPQRDESSPQLCLPTEYHVRCGPERHCERSCDNLFSPPRCEEHDATNPKCYFPRCLCRAGFVRDSRGKCIKPKLCRVSFEEAFHRQDPDGIFFKSHRLNKQRRARHFRQLLDKYKKTDENYFW